MEKLPPIEKIYEAYSALADGRVTLKQDHGEVYSSDWSKCYTVSFQDDVYSANDNATYWQGYAGYPVIAVLFKQGRLTYDEKTLQLFKDINWKQLNDQYKRNYAAAAEAIMQERNMDQEEVKAQSEAIYQELASLNIVTRRGKLRPPK